ncbi:MAG: hypothetical protein HRT92_02410 [Piscirickettsiaceae bacterium]|nr:hypothetical protein [Piscirickettsiaceae bacterium]
MLLTSLVILILSGILLIPTALDMQWEWNVIWRLSGEQYLIAVAMHTAVSYLTLTALGALIPIHMKAGFITKKNHFSGLCLIFFFVILATTGIGLLYLAHGQFILLIDALHIVMGIILIIIFLVHYNFRNRRQGNSIAHKI